MTFSFLPQGNGAMAIRLLATWCLFAVVGTSTLHAQQGNTLRTGNTDALGALLQSAQTVTEAQEIELGRQVASILVSGKPLDPDPALHRYVNQLGSWLALQSSRPQLPWTFAVVDESDYHAYSTPGGYVFVTRGLIDRCADEAELAGVLAHEIAHVSHKHHLQAMHKAAQSGAGAQGLAGLAAHVFYKGVGADAEYAADREAVALAGRAGLDPFGLVAALVQMHALGDSDLLVAESHPPSQVRLDQLEQAMGKRLDHLAGIHPQVTIAQRLAAPLPQIAPASVKPTAPAATGRASRTRK
jgi:predicted Zn-dependent protease